MAKKNFLGNSRNSSNGLRIVLNPLFEFRGGNRNYFGRYRSDYFIRIVFNPSGFSMFSENMKY